MSRAALTHYKRSHKGYFPILFTLLFVLMFSPIQSQAPTKRLSPVSRAQLHEIIRQNHQNPKLVQAIITVESRWDARAVSNRGAVGLMQVMPSSAKSYGFTREDLFCP